MIRPLKRIRHGSIHVIADPAAGHARLAGLLLPDPDRSLDNARLLPGKGRSCVTAIVTLEGRPYLLKKFEYRGRWYGLRHLFKRSRALRVFVNQRLAWQAGVSTPEPLVCIEERRFGLLLHCYVLCRYIPDSQTLEVCWESLSSDEKPFILEQCGHLMGTLHRRGITHGDSNWRNILVTRSDEGPKPWFIDFDGSMHPWFQRENMFQKDLGHFLRDMRWRKLPNEDVRHFVEAWHGSRGR